MPDPLDQDALADEIAQYAQDLEPDGDSLRTAEFVLEHPEFAPNIPPDLLVRYQLAKIDKAIRGLLPFRPTTEEVLAQLREEDEDKALIAQENAWLIEDTRARMEQERQREYLRRLDELRGS